MIRWKLNFGYKVLWTLILSGFFCQRITALTVDNQLVSARNGKCKQTIELLLRKHIQMYISNLFLTQFTDENFI